MLANPKPEKSLFGLVTNGTNFIFLKLTKQNQIEYALSDELSLLKRGNDLYQILKTLRKISQAIT